MRNRYSLRALREQRERRERRARAIRFALYCATVLGLYACAALGLLIACSIADAAHHVPAFASPANLIGCIASYTAATLLILASAGVLFFAPIVLHPRND